MSRQSRLLRRLAAAVLVLSLGWLAQQAGIDLPGESSSHADPKASSTSPTVPMSAAEGVRDSNDSGAGAVRVERAYERKQSGFMVTVDATVAKTLADDDDGSRHQRFLIELPTGRTLLVAHNIDLADRVPLGRGDSIRIRGQYEWNDRGGVLHWTHHDPAGRHPGGWIEYRGQRTE